MSTLHRRKFVNERRLRVAGGDAGDPGAPPPREPRARGKGAGKPRKPKRRGKGR